MQGFWLLAGAYKQINNAKQTRTQIELNHTHTHTHLMSLKSFPIYHYAIKYTWDFHTIVLITYMYVILKTTLHESHNSAVMSMLRKTKFRYDLA